MIRTCSCINYESGGGFGFSKDRFTDDKTWSQAGLSFATSFAASAATIGMKQGLGIKSNLLATTATTSINTVSSNFTVGGDGSWNWGGWGNIDTQKAVITGVGSYVSSTATGNMRDPYMNAFAGSVINSYTTALTANMFERFGGRDFGDQYSLDRPVSVDTLSISVNQAYGDARSRIMSDGSHEAATPVDNRSFWEKIGDGFAGAGESLLSIGKSFSDEVGDIVSDAKKIGRGVVDLALSAYKNVSDSLGLNKRIVISEEQRRLQESWWRSEDGQLSIMEKQIALTYYKDKDFKLHFVDGLGLNSKLTDVAKDINSVEGFKENNIDNEKINGNRFFRNYENIKEFNNYFDAKNRLSRNFDGSYALDTVDKTNLVKSVRQNPDQALSVQLQKEYGMSRSQANRHALTSCASNTLFTQLKIIGALEGSYSSYLKENVGRITSQGEPFISERTGYLNASISGIVSKYSVDGNSIEAVGYGRGFKNSDISEAFDAMYSNNYVDGVVRYTYRAPDDRHSMNVLNNKGDPLFNDPSFRGYGVNVHERVDEKNLKSFYYLKIK